ncbi:MAG: hypothetical protein P8X79_16560 [Reinekea sp.]
MACALRRYGVTDSGVNKWVLGRLHQPFQQKECQLLTGDGFCGHNVSLNP